MNQPSMKMLENEMEGNIAKIRLMRKLGQDLSPKCVLLMYTAFPGQKSHAEKGHRMRNERIALSKRQKRKAPKLRAQSCGRETSPILKDPS